MATETAAPRKQRAFAADAEQALRLAGKIACSKTVSRADLWQALTSRATEELPKAQLCLEPGLAVTVARATELAAAQSQAAVTRSHLLEALLEDEALALGLSLAMLRFHRWRAERSGSKGGLRQGTAEPTPAGA